MIRFLQPQRNGDAFRCDYQIDWPDRQRQFHGFGVDAVQALMLAMMMARVELLTSPEGKAGALLWFGRRELGLPSEETLAGNDQNPNRTEDGVLVLWVRHCGRNLPRRCWAESLHLSGVYRYLYRGDGNGRPSVA